MFGVYVHIPFCAHRCDYCDFATWTDRAHLVDAYVDACVADLERAGRADAPARDERVLRRRHAVAARRPPQLAAHPRRDRPHRRRRGHGRVQSRQRRRGQARGVPGRGREPAARSACSRCSRTCSPRSAARTIPRTSTRAVALARAAGFDDVNLDLIYGTPGESVDDWRAHARRRARARLDARERVRAHRRARHAARPARRRGHARRARRRRPGRQVRASPTTCSRAAGFEWYEISNWAQPGRRVPAQPPATGRRASTSRSAAPRTATPTGGRWWNVRTPERYIERDRGRRVARGRARDARPDARRARRRSCSRLRTRGGRVDRRRGADAAVGRARRRRAARPARATGSC